MHVHVHAYRGWSGLYNVNTNATDGMYGTVLPTSNTKPSFQRGSDSHPASVFEGAGPCAARRVSLSSWTPRLGTAATLTTNAGTPATLQRVLSSTRLRRLRGNRSHLWHLISLALFSRACP